jgi:hypothetical protein
MSAPEFMDQVHPTDETLAAFLDGRLDKNQRRAVIEHLAECGECRTFVNDISDIKAMDEAEGNVVPMPARGGGWRAAVASLAVAAGLVVVFRADIQRWTVGATDEQVAALGAKLETRPSEGRLSIDMPYKKPRRVDRGGESTPEPILVDGVPSDVHTVLSNLYDAKRRDPHKLGLTCLMAMRYNEAIPYLEEAAQTSDEAKIDLAAALIGRGRDADLDRAIKLSQGNTPRELWNRAAALDRRNDKEAMKAWEAYLRVDSDPASEWANEARRKIADLKLFAEP